jgi:phosphohistidine phosphatase
MKLYLMRHGEAAQTSQSSEQVLTPGGRACIENLAKQLQGKNLYLAQVFHSGKLRAQQTAEIICHELCPDVTPRILDKIKPDDNPVAILPVINSWNEDSLITSHLPFIPNLVTLLTTTNSHLNSINYEPGTFICLKKNNNVWEIKWVEAP